MTKMIMQIRWLMVMSRVRSWKEFTSAHAMRFFIQSNAFLKGLITASNLKYIYWMMKRSLR